MCSCVMTSKVAVAVTLVNFTRRVKVKVAPLYAFDGNELKKCLSTKRATHAKLNVRILGQKDFLPGEA